MNRMLVFLMVLAVGATFRFAPSLNWPWWADLLLILLTALSAATVPQDGRK